MAQTRAMTAAGRATVPAKMSKPVGITKKKKVSAAKKPAPIRTTTTATTKRKAAAARKQAPARTSTATTTRKPAAAAVRKGSKRRAAENDDGEAPAPAAKRAKANRAERFASKPTTHRYGTRSNLSAAAPSPAPPAAAPVLPAVSAAVALPPAPLSPSPEREPGQVLPLPLPLPVDFVPSALTPTDPVSTTLFSGARLSPLVVERGGPLSPPELSDDQKARTLGGHRFLAKLKLAKDGKPVLKQHIEAGYQPAKYHAILFPTEPRLIDAGLGQKEEEAYWDKDKKETQARARRVMEREAEYAPHTNFAKRSNAGYRMQVRTLRKKWSTLWKRYLWQSRQLELTERSWRGKKWEYAQVHEPSPLGEDCSAALEEEQRLMDVHAERVAARERFQAAFAAGEIEDADEYGDDYDPFEEDY
ncbi:hypothetical protein VTL71DRAFT_8507 [Oculimacula yallundae]|uniref:Uncharacterized protein n=1 Tax=Oculimacula yallundae TaxID=86028 RepID=A0ABR4CY15_9HELO